jgi:ribosomal protein S18 acetylase RimI-like enzyme
VNLVIVSRLQTYLRSKAHYDGREAVRIPPFTLFFNPHVDHAYEGVAIPDEFQPIMGYPAEAVEGLCTAFDVRGRVPFVRFLDAFAPGLPISLHLSGKGFQESSRLPVLACTPESLIHPPDVPGLDFVVISNESPLDDVKDSLDVNSQGFDPQPNRVDDRTAAKFRGELVNNLAFIARLNGRPVAAGMFTEIRDSMTELVGITTLPQYRGRGIGAALTAYMTRTAFESGVEIAFLIAATQDAQRVYQRIGYRVVANLLEFEAVQVTD